MQRFISPFGAITFTDERMAHILTFHPDVRRYLQHFAPVLANPEMVISSAHDPAVVICYGQLSRTRKYLAIVMKKGVKPFILTAYVAKRPKKL